MTEDSIRDLMSLVKDGTVDLDEAVNRLKNLPYEDLGFAHIDHHRTLRKGHPETIFGEGKTVEQITMIAQRMLQGQTNIMVTRVGEEIYHALKRSDDRAEYHQEARIVSIVQNKGRKTKSKILVMSAGTSEMLETSVLTARTSKRHLSHRFSSFCSPPRNLRTTGVT